MDEEQPAPTAPPAPASTEPTYMVRLTAKELEANLWCINTLSSSWLGAPNGTAIHGLKDKLQGARLGGSTTAQGALGKATDIR